MTADHPDQTNPDPPAAGATASSVDTGEPWKAPGLVND
jgi:hypothetical protein